MSRWHYVSLHMDNKEGIGPQTPGLDRVASSKVHVHVLACSLGRNVSTRADQPRREKPKHSELRQQRTQLGLMPDCRKHRCLLGVVGSYADAKIGRDGNDVDLLVSSQPMKSETA